MYNDLLKITITGLIVGTIGTSLGGLAAFFLKNPNNRLMSFILGISGGLMLSVVTFDLLPEAFNSGGVALTIIALILGVFITVLIEKMLPNYDSLSKEKGQYFKTALLMAIGLALHNFPEGLAIGSGFVYCNKLGIGLSLVIGMHDIPEGMAVSAPMSFSNIKPYKAFLYTILTALPTGIGAFIGALVGEISPIFVTLCLSFAAGTMLYIVCGELIPKSKSLYESIKSTLFIILGIILGIILTSIVTS